MAKQLEQLTGGLVVCRPKPIPYWFKSAQGLTLMSDLHIGAAHVDYDLIKQELATAKKNDDRILINGDVFDMILAKDHKRFTPGVLHPKLRGRNDIVNAAVEWGAEILGPYADRIDMIAFGNHESSLEKYGSIDAIKLLIYELEKKLTPATNKKKPNGTAVASTKHTIHYGGYSGFVDYRFSYASGSENDKTQKQRGKRYVIYYHHGSGGAAPVTKGMIDFARRSWPEADCIWMGHKHNRFNASIYTVRCPKQGDEPISKEVRHIMTGAYFKTYCGQTQASVKQWGRVSNYAADAGMSPQGMGGARLVLTFPRPDEVVSTKVEQ